MGTGRTAFDVYRHYQIALNTKLLTKDWTQEETHQLVSLVEAHRGEVMQVTTFSPLLFESRCMFVSSSNYLFSRELECGEKYLQPSLTRRMISAEIVMTLAR